MDLGHHRQHASLARVGVGDAVDHPHLPQRPAAIQRQGCDMSAYLGQFPTAARRRQPDAEQVTIEVERVVVDPHRIVQIELTIGQLCPELGDGRDPCGQFVAKPIKGVATGHRGGVQLEDRAHVNGLGEAFDVEETGVEPAEPFHVLMLGAMSTRRTQLGRTATSFRKFHSASCTTVCSPSSPPPLSLARRPRVDHSRAEDDVMQRPSPAVDHDPQQADREDHAADRTQKSDEAG